jgi:hypothetical protein
MTVILELEKRVEEAQKKLTTALADLSTFADFKKQLEAAGAGLSSSSTALTALAQKVESHTESLSEAAKSLSAAVEIMKQTDFGEIQGSIIDLKSRMHESNENVLTQLQKMSNDVQNTTNAGHETTVSQLKHMKNQLSEEILEVSSNTSSPIVEHLTKKIENAASISMKQAFATWALISICIILLIYSVILER